MAGRSDRRRAAALGALVIAATLAPAGSPPSVRAGPASGVSIRGSPAFTPDQTEAPETAEPTTTTTPGTEASDQLLPENVNLGVVRVFEEITQTLVIFNEGNTEITFDAVTVDGAGFELAEEDCTGPPLMQNEDCQISIRFAPTEIRGFTGTLTVEVNGPTEVTTLQGTGIGPPVATVTLPPTSETPPPPTTGTPPPLSTVPDTAPSTTTPDDPDADLAALTEECERRARQAEVRYPDRLVMTVGRESDVKVNVTLEGTPPPSTESGTPDTVIDTATLTCFVTAVLSGSNFDIDPASQTGDFVLSATIDWSWDVVPKSTGRHDLDLRIIPRIGSGADTREGTPRTFRADITVIAEPRSTWEVISDFVSDLVQSPVVQLLVAGGVLGGLGAAIRKRFAAALARRRERTSGNDGHKNGYL